MPGSRPKHLDRADWKNTGKLPLLAPGAAVDSLSLWKNRVLSLNDGLSLYNGGLWLEYAAFTS